MFVSYSMYIVGLMWVLGSCSLPGDHTGNQALKSSVSASLVVLEIVCFLNQSAFRCMVCGIKVFLQEISEHVFTYLFKIKLSLV